MKILFISSGKSGGVNPIVRNQGESLKKAGHEVSYFVINGKGIFGYFRNIFTLKRFLKHSSFDILHAHYSFSGFTAYFAKNKSPLIVSLMGSDVHSSPVFRTVISFFSRFCWDATIVKSSEMLLLLKGKRTHVIPNGVDIELFNPREKNISRNKLNLSPEKKIIIFVADPKRIEKNYPLALEAISTLNREDVVLLPVFNVSNELVSEYMTAADVLLLTSRYEGSVNVVKEAMACNLPVVSTDVGDVTHNLQGVECCYISKSNPKDLANSLHLALECGNTSNGREKLISLGLDSKTIAQKIIGIYQEQLNKQNDRSSNN